MVTALLAFLLITPPTTLASSNLSETNATKFGHVSKKFTPKRIHRHSSSQYYDPCDYPRPSDAEEYLQQCSSAYLGSAIFCDPDHQFSRTESDVLSNQLSQLNITSCLCGYPTTLLSNEFEVCSVFRGAILFAGAASILIKRKPNALIGIDNIGCNYAIKSADPVHEMTKVEQMQLFAQNILRIWRKDSKCELDSLLIVINKWHPYEEHDNFSRIIVYTSPRLQHHSLDANQLSPIVNDLRQIVVVPIAGRPSDVFIKLKYIITELKNGRFNFLTDKDKRRFEHLSGESITDSTDMTRGANKSSDLTISMPDWAIILFVVCILMLPLCVLIGNVVSVVPSRRLTHATADPISMRWTHKRWRAGFGGGFFGVRWKTPITTAGDPAATQLQERPKPQSNNMMFRQFSKFKRPLKSAQSSGAGESRLSNWTYV